MLQMWKSDYLKIKAPAYETTKTDQLHFDSFLSEDEQWYQSNLGRESPPTIFGRV